MTKKLRMNDKGVALVTALVMSVAIMVMVVGALYFISRSTALSGAGKRYATAAEAADGAVEAAKDAINIAMWGGAPSGSLYTNSACFATTLTTDNSTCAATINLPGTVGGNYTAGITVTRLYSVDIPGGRLEFARSASGTPSRAVYFRITSRVTGPNNTSAENAALYRFTG